MLFYVTFDYSVLHFFRNDLSTCTCLSKMEFIKKQCIKNNVKYSLKRWKHSLTHFNKRVCKDLKFKGQDKLIYKLSSLALYFLTKLD